jgi:hypothetical protein
VKRSHGQNRGTAEGPEYIWSEDIEPVDPWEVGAFCAGCLRHVGTFTLAKLDSMTRVPAQDRLLAGHWLTQSVGCPMPGPSHEKVVLHWRRTLAVAA